MKIKGFDWDSGNWPKCGKHGVSQDEIEQLFLNGEAAIAPDLKHSTLTESRHIAVGRINSRAMFVAFAFRNGLIRPISARYMHPKEAKNYEKNT
jgi:uncharacterized protein